MFLWHSHLIRLWFKREINFEFEFDCWFCLKGKLIKWKYSSELCSIHEPHLTSWVVLLLCPVVTRSTRLTIISGHYTLVSKQCTGATVVNTTPGMTGSTLTTFTQIADSSQGTNILTDSSSPTLASCFSLHSPVIGMTESFSIKRWLDTGFF